MIAEKIANLPNGVRLDRADQALTDLRATSQKEAVNAPGPRMPRFAERIG
jgi:hypothetical protein